MTRLTIATAGVLSKDGVVPTPRKLQSIIPRRATLKPQQYQNLSAGNTPTKRKVFNSYGGGSVTQSLSQYWS